MRTTILFFSLLLTISTNIFASGTKTVSLKMAETATTLTSTTQIYFATGTSGAYVAVEDSKENSGTLQSIVYTLSDNGIACNSNGFGDLATSVVVNIGYQAEQTGTYTFSVSKGFGIEEGSIVILEDRLMGTFVNLLQKTSTVQLTKGQNQSRFYLHVSAAPIISTVTAGCNDNNGSINVNEDGAVLWASVLLFDSNQVAIQEVHDTATDFSFTNLPGGKYFVGFFTATGYVSIKVIQVPSQSVQLSISASATKADVGQTIQFYSVVSNGTQYSWDFGDSSTITGIANPSYDFYQAGNYTITLRATNEFECSATAQMNMVVGVQVATSVSNIASEGINVYSSSNNVIISNTNLTTTNSTCEIYNLAGQLLINVPVTSAYAVVNMENQSAGMYIVQMKTTNGNFTKKIYVGSI